MGKQLRVVGGVGECRFHVSGNGPGALHMACPLQPAHQRLIAMCPPLNLLGSSSHPIQSGVKMDLSKGRGDVGQPTTSRHTSLHYPYHLCSEKFLSRLVVDGCRHMSCYFPPRCFSLQETPPLHRIYQPTIFCLILMLLFFLVLGSDDPFQQRIHFIESK